MKHSSCFFPAVLGPGEWSLSCEKFAFALWQPPVLLSTASRKQFPNHIVRELRAKGLSDKSYSIYLITWRFLTVSWLNELSPKATDDNESASSSLTADVRPSLPCWQETFATPWCFWEFQGPVSWSSDCPHPLETAVVSCCLIKVNCNPRNENESFQSHFCFC